jgi:hypothetical protein
MGRKDEKIKHKAEQKMSDAVAMILSKVDFYMIIPMKKARIVVLKEEQANYCRHYSNKA